MENILFRIYFFVILYMNTVFFAIFATHFV